MPPKSDSTSLARKRKTPPTASSNQTNNNRKSQIHASRIIPAQPPEAALKNGELDLQAFVAAHEFEIRSLEQSMATSKAAGTSRAFQKVPRGLRRRTASHNPKRVPKRLRARALREMADDNTPTVQARRRKPRTTRARIRAETAKRLRLLVDRKRRRALRRKLTQQQQKAGTNESESIKDAAARKPRPKIRRNMLNDPPKPASSKFRKRQINKTWLPTHAWHTKRARMTEPKNPLWRFAIPVTPNEKIYRPVHRAQGQRGAIVWDMSYMSTIGIYGNSAGMERVLKRIGVFQGSCWNEKGTRWRAGTRSWSGVLSRECKGERRQICPAVMIWNPLPVDTLPSDTVSTEELSNKKPNRQVFLRMHPSAFLEVFNELLRLSKMETPQLYIEDLRFEIGSIETTGPASTELLLQVLTPHGIKEKAPSSKSKHAELFQSLTGLSNPSSLPDNAVLGFSAQDARLRYPPRKAKTSPSHDQEDDDMKLLKILASWPAEENLKPYDIFDRNARHVVSSLPSQGHINRRRSTIAPGAFLKPTPVDPPIPILLLANRASSSSSSSNQGTWTLLAPWKSIASFWHSIVHCPLTSGGNPRFAGLEETRQVAFERGAAWFPADYVATNAGAEWELEQRRLRSRKWERRPKSKRLEWKTVDLGAGRKGEIGNGLACDFEFLFGLEKMETSTTTTTTTTGMKEVISEDAMDLDDDDDKPSSSPVVSTHIEPLRLLNHMSKLTFTTLLSAKPSSPPPIIPPNSIITVRITLLGRGVVTPCARIYRLPPCPLPGPDVQVPATIPPPQSTSTSTSSTTTGVLPLNLRAQWLAQIPSSSSSSSQTKKRRTNNKKPKDLETRKQILAQELTSTTTTSLHNILSSISNPNNNSTDINNHHPLVPDTQDLIGFVTTGSFNLSQGRGIAIASLAVAKILDTQNLDDGDNKKYGRFCIVREAGGNVGRIAKWEII